MVYAVMPQREEMTQIRNISMVEEEKVRKETFHHSTEISSEDEVRSVGQNKKKENEKSNCKARQQHVG